MVRFLHTADLHIDRAFEGVQPTETLFSNQLLSANEQTLERIIDVAIDEQVDFLIVAGDTFHQSYSSPKTQKILLEAFQRLAEKEINVFLVFGNHDFYEASRFWFRFPENVYLFTEEAVKTVLHITKSGEKVAISGFSYQNQWITERKATEFPERLKEADVHVGIYHGEMGGKSARYAPFSLQEMQVKRYDYWALGHIHQAEILDSDGRIRYAGAPVGHTRKETKSHSVNLVELTRETIQVQEISVAALTFQLISCDVSEIQTMEALRFLLQEKIEEIRMQTLQFVEIQLENVAEELLPALDEQELMEFFNALFPLQLSISKISWRLRENEQQKIEIPFTKQEISERLEKFQQQELLAVLSEPLTSKRGLEEVLDFLDSDFQENVYKEAAERFYSRFALESVE